jgi:serine/threonine-protein kinase
VDKALEQRVIGATVAGKYRIRRVVGQGSMGVVCEAEHLDIGKRLAIKIIDASLAGMKDIALRFRQEARAASLVESQHIVQVFDAGADDALGLYLVMEYLVGEDLAAVLEREGRLDPDVAVRIAVQAARGLAKAHEAGVIHRDLKPANIFLVEREEDEPLVKILDFGISKVQRTSLPDGKLGLTRAGTVVGTPQYMSPEQAQGYSVDERTDVWALGLVLYEMLAGRPAYPELHTYEAFIIRLASHPPDPLSEVAPWVPAPLAEVVHLAASHDVNARIRKAALLAQRLTIAHPPDGARGARGLPFVAADVADTWSDDSTRSPYADRDPNDEPVPAEATASDEAPDARQRAEPDTDEAPHARQRAEPDTDAAAVTGENGSASPTAIMSRRPPELLVVDARPGGRRDVATALPDSAPRAIAALAVRSGIRGPAEAADIEDDAPQFFDRRELDTFAPPPMVGAHRGEPRAPWAPLSGEPVEPMTGARGDAPTPVQEQGPATPDEAAAAPGNGSGVREPRVAASPAAQRGLSARRSLAWLAVAFITLGLAVVAILAFR